MSDEPPVEETQPEPEQRPILRIVSGNPSDEELAALVAVVAAIGGGQPNPAPRRTPEWSAHHRKVRTSFPHGPGGWRSSALPR